MNAWTIEFYIDIKIPRDKINCSVPIADEILEVLIEIKETCSKGFLQNMKTCEKQMCKKL